MRTNLADMLKRWQAVIALLITFFLTSPLHAQNYTLSSFKSQQLSSVYFSEGATAGDINADGKMDVVCGPYWYEGPAFTKKHEIYKPVPQNRERYANNFFSWVYDFNGDGHNDVLAAGFPGTPGYVYQNPGPDSQEHWKKHEVLDWVSNESPQFTNIVGDDRPELVCTRDGFFGFATLNRDAKSFGKLSFHAISAQIAPKKFGHGLGVGDVNGDGLIDLVFSGGWFQQPKQGAMSRRWQLHKASFSNSYGGAEMHVYDVDGDGDNDIITCHAAHDFGLGWYEQIRQDSEITFKHHLIMGDRPEQNRYGLVFSELHSVNLVDMDGDGLKDIVTGKTFWSHHRQSPMWDADPVVYWFRLTRTDKGVDWVPYRAGIDSGIGRQVTVLDINQDAVPDIIVGGMKGTYVLTHRRRQVDKSVWLAHHPKVYVPTGKRTDRGAPATFGDNKRIAGAIEGESMTIVQVSGGKARVQSMTGFKKGRWSGGKQLFWSGATPRARLLLEFEVEKDGEYQIGAVLTTARDYAIVNLQLDGVAIGTSIDLYDYPNVSTTGLLKLGTRKIKAGKHRLLLETIGANDSAIKAYMVGLDCLVLEKK